MPTQNTPELAFIQILVAEFLHNPFGRVTHSFVIGSIQIFPSEIFLHLREVLSIQIKGLADEH